MKPTDVILASAIASLLVALVSAGCSTSGVWNATAAGSTQSAPCDWGTGTMYRQCLSTSAWNVQVDRSKCTIFGQPSTTNPGRCGASFAWAICDPSSIYTPCCSNYGWCGNTDAHCLCTQCVDFRTVILNPKSTTTTPTAAPASTASQPSSSTAPAPTPTPSDSCAATGNWPTTSIGQTASITCDIGAGQMTRPCTSGGWGAIDRRYCVVYGVVSTNGHCGPSYNSTICDKNSFYPCCSQYGSCGNTDLHCLCATCIDYSKLLVNPPSSFPPNPNTWDPSRGWDFECHTRDHLDMTTLTDDQIAAQLTGNTALFVQHNLPAPSHFSYPFGAQDARVRADTGLLRLSARTINNNYNRWPIVDWMQIQTKQWYYNVSLSTMLSWIDECVAQHTLTYLYAHRVLDASDPALSSIDLTTDKFYATVQYAAQQRDAGKLKILTHAQAYDYWVSASDWPVPTLVFTFDDGRRTDRTVVYPYFKSFGIVGTSFIRSGYYTETPAAWGDVSTYLAWSDILTMYNGQ